MSRNLKAMRMPFFHECTEVLPVATVCIHLVLDLADSHPNY